MYAIYEDDILVGATAKKESVIDFVNQFSLGHGKTLRVFKCTLDDFPTITRISNTVSELVEAVCGCVLNYGYENGRIYIVNSFEMCKTHKQYWEDDDA